MNVIRKDLSAFDYFNILTFSDTMSYWKEESQSVNADSLHDAQTFVNQTEAVGGKLTIKSLIRVNHPIALGNSNQCFVRNVSYQIFVMPCREFSKLNSVNMVVLRKLSFVTDNTELFPLSVN